MGKNKLKKFEQLAAYDHVIESEFKDIFNKDHFLKGNWRRDYFKNDHPVVLELGCGKGEYTVGLAGMFPHKNFIGIDIKGARMHKGATDVLEKGLKNAAFLRTRIEFINSFFGTNEVDEIWITFPDPQMKKPNKRLTATTFLQRYMAFVKPQGLIHLKTDSNFLYTYTYELVRHNGLEIEVNETDLYHSDYANDIRSLKTHYEQKWLGRGIAIKYLLFRLHAGKTLEEPEVEIEFDAYHSKGTGSRDKEWAAGERMSGR
ncbi:MAG: tRNA (guanosine(46)-N7)-methyltransferase TrmB [Breznakibacter sp.]